MTNFKNKIVLITGGASGIGKIMGRLSIERGATLVVWDINSHEMAVVYKEFSAYGKVYTYVVDITDEEAIRGAYAQVRADAGPVDILINNAGIVIGKNFSEQNTAEMHKTMEVNAIAPMVVARVMMDDMIARNTGHICNIASSAGLVSNPKMSVYAASKWAVIGWSDSLRLELEKAKRDIRITTILPYYIDTGMFAGVKSIVPILKPEQAARTIIRSIERNRIIRTLPGYAYRLTRLGQAIFPLRLYDWILGDLLGIYRTMDHFEAKK